MEAEMPGADTRTAEIRAARAATPRQLAKRALWWVLGGGIIAWVLCLLAVFSDVAIETGRPYEELWGPGAVVTVRPSLYLYFAAIAVFTLSGLIGRRSLIKASAPAEAVVPAETTALVRAVQRFASTVVITGLVLSAWAAVIVFMSNFFGPTDDDAIFERVLNSYLPIVLYTALVVAVILAAFVFTRSSATATPPSVQAASSSPSAAAGRTPISTPDGSPAAPAANPQRATALGFALPIIAVAVALVFGLIVYDLTHTPLDAWIWVIVELCIALGIIAGTIYAARAIAAHRTSAGAGSAATGSAAPVSSPGPAIGAQNLNLVLTIIFAGAVTAMSLGYGTSAIHQLQIQPWLTLSAYAENPGGDAVFGAGSTEVPFEDISIYASGSGLARGSDAMIAVQPGGEILIIETVDRTGYLSIAGELTSELEAGDYELELTATAADGAAESLSIEFTVTDDDTVLLGSVSDISSDHQPSRLMSPNAPWIFGDLLPAVILLLLVVSILRVTLLARHRER